MEIHPSKLAEALIKMFKGNDLSQERKVDLSAELRLAETGAGCIEPEVREILQYQRALLIPGIYPQYRSKHSPCISLLAPCSGLRRPVWSPRTPLEHASSWVVSSRSENQIECAHLPLRLAHVGFESLPYRSSLVPRGRVLPGS